MPNQEDFYDEGMLLKRIRSLEQENAMLKQILKENGIPLLNEHNNPLSAICRLSS